MLVLRDLLTTISVKEVTFDESDGTLTLFEHPDNIPRVEYDADSNRLGLLVEESRTNVIEYSEDLSQWSSGTRITLSATDVTETPDGQRGAYKAVATTLNTNHYFEPVGSTPYLKTTTAGTTWTFSIFAKAAENTVLQIASSSGFLSKYQNFDLTNGVKLSGDVDGSAIQAVGNGWYKCSVTQDTVGTTARFILIPANSDISRNPSFVGDGTSGIYVWGGQAEESASFPTSYIKTTGSTATRSADVASIPVADFGYNADEGSVVVEAQHFTTATTAHAAFGLDDGTSSNRLYYYQNKGQWIGSVSGTTTMNIDGADPAENTLTKTGVAYKENDYAHIRNGSNIGFDTTSPGVPVVTTLGIGQSSVGTLLTATSSPSNTTHVA